MRPSIAIMLIAAAGAAVYAGCGGESPTHIGRPPVVQGFSPQERQLLALIGDTLSFSIRAFDPDRGALRAWYTMGDSLTGSGNDWRYVVDDTGTTTISAYVSDDTYSARISWVLTRIQPVNIPPVIARFFPVEPNPTMVINTPVEFAVEASDADGDSLDFSFSVDDTLVASSARFEFRPTRTGNRRIEALVSDGEDFDSHAWNVRVTGIPDTIAPAEVVLTRVEAGADPGELDLEWIAVGKDGMDGQASNYLVRTSPTPILDEYEWTRASEHPDVPAAVPAGQTMAMTLTHLQPARFTHLAVRAVDDFGNLSPLGDSPGLYTRGMEIYGVVYDALSLATLEGMTVRLSSLSVTTASDGSYAFTGLPIMTTNLSVTDDDVGSQIGAYYDYSRPYEVVHLQHVPVYMIPDIPITTQFYDDFYFFFRAMTDDPQIPPTSGQRRWELPIDLYVPPYNNGGLDYAQTIKSVAADFDTVLGVQVFKIVDAEPALGIKIDYRPGLYADNYLVTDRTPDYYPVRARIQHRTTFTPASMEALRKVSRHELGHALGLQHSDDPMHMMHGVGSPTANDFSADEVHLLQVRFNLPRGYDTSHFSWE